MVCFAVLSDSHVVMVGADRRAFICAFEPRAASFIAGLDPLEYPSLEVRKPCCDWRESDVLLMEGVDDVAAHGGRIVCRTGAELVLFDVKVPQSDLTGGAVWFERVRAAPVIIRDLVVDAPNDTCFGRLAAFGSEIYLVLNEKTIATFSLELECTMLSMCMSKVTDAILTQYGVVFALADKTYRMGLNIVGEHATEAGIHDGTIRTLLSWSSFAPKPGADRDVVRYGREWYEIVDEGGKRTKNFFAAKESHQLHNGVAFDFGLNSLELKRYDMAPKRRQRLIDIRALVPPETFERVHEYF